MLELEHRFRAVDVGATLDPDRDRERDRGRAVAPDRLERELHQAGVVRAVVTPRGREPETLAGTEGYLAANNAVARLCVERPFVPFARLAGARDVGGPGSRLRNLTARRKPLHASPDDVERYAYGDRFEGFVLDPAGDGLPDESVLAALADVGLPVRVHTAPSFPPNAVEQTLLEYEFPTVLAGFGGYPLDRDRMTDALSLLDAHEELYVDTAAVRFRDVLERALREHPDRVLFGSDAPAVHPSVGVMELLTLSVPEDAMRRAFEANPTRVVPSLGPGE